MKRFLLLFTLSLLSTTFVGCSDDDDDDNNAVGPVGTNYFTVTIDGVQKSFANVSSRWVDGGNYLEINATNDGNEWVSITVLNDTTRVPAGSYTLNDSSPFSILSIYSIGQLNYTATKDTLAAEDAFTLNITDIDNGSVEGTFSGVLVIVQGENTLDMATLQNGSFRTAIAPN